MTRPKLLSGGNPQIPKGEGTGPVRDYIAAMPGWKRAVGKRLDELIVAAVPDVHKGVKWNQPFYGRKGEGWFISFRCYTNYVQLQFFKGTSLDPMPPKASKHDGCATSTSVKTMNLTRPNSGPGSSRPAICPA